MPRGSILRTATKRAGHGGTATCADGPRRTSRGGTGFRRLNQGLILGEQIPAHIHLTIKEPNRREYWIDEIVFEGDSRLTAALRNRLEDRGGSGIVRLTRDDAGTWHGTRDVRLEPHPEDP